MEVALWAFYRGTGDEKRGVGNEAEAREYLLRLNSGIVDRPYVMRKLPNAVNLAAENAKGVRSGKQVDVSVSIPAHHPH